MEGVEEQRVPQQLRGLALVVRRRPQPLPELPGPRHRPLQHVVRVRRRLPQDPVQLPPLVPERVREHRPAHLLQQLPLVRQHVHSMYTARHRMYTRSASSTGVDRNH